VRERRGLKRRHLIYYLRVFDRDLDRLMGHLVDVTSEGVMVISEHPIQAERTYRMGMVLPEGPEGNRQIAFRARSIWCQKDVNPSFYAAGFQLLNLPQKDVETINWLIDEFGFQD